MTAVSLREIAASAKLGFQATPESFDGEAHKLGPRAAARSLYAMRPAHRRDSGLRIASSRGVVPGRREYFHLEATMRIRKDANNDDRRPI